VAAVERPDPDARVLGDGGDRRPGIGEEDLACSLENPLVVARSLGTAAAEWARLALARRWGLLLGGHRSTVTEQSIPFN